MIQVLIIFNVGLGLSLGLGVGLGLILLVEAVCFVKFGLKIGLLAGLLRGLGIAKTGVETYDKAIKYFF